MRDGKFSTLGYAVIGKVEVYRRIESASWKTGRPHSITVPPVPIGRHAAA